jgi:very-short-patch-repair endonuclease
MTQAEFNKPEFKALRRKLRNGQTPQEKILWARLKADQLGVRFRRQHGISAYIADLYCPSLRLVIEIDGSQHYDVDRVRDDRERSAALQALGCTVVRFTNAEINTAIDSVVMSIAEEVERIQNQLHPF